MTIEKELTKFNYLLTGLFEDGLEIGRAHV